MKESGPILPCTPWGQVSAVPDTSLKTQRLQGREAVNALLRLCIHNHTCCCHFCRVLWPLFFSSSIFTYIHPSTYSLVSKRPPSFAILRVHGAVACLSPPLAERGKSNRCGISHTVTPGSSLICCFKSTHNALPQLDWRGELTLSLCCYDWVLRCVCTVTLMRRTSSSVVVFPTLTSPPAAGATAVICPAP